MYSLQVTVDWQFYQAFHLYVIWAAFFQAYCNIFPTPHHFVPELTVHIFVANTLPLVPVSLSASYYHNNAV